MAAIKWIVVLNQRRLHSQSHLVFSITFAILRLCPNQCFSRSFASHLLTVVGPNLSRPTWHSHPLSPEIQVLAGLRFLYGRELYGDSWKCLCVAVHSGSHQHFSVQWQITYFCLPQGTKSRRIAGGPFLYYYFFSHHHNVVFVLVHFACWCAFIENVSQSEKIVNYTSRLMWWGCW